MPEEEVAVGTIMELKINLDRYTDRKCLEDMGQVQLVGLAGLGNLVSMDVLGQKVCFLAAWPHDYLKINH